MRSHSNIWDGLDLGERVRFHKFDFFLPLLVLQGAVQDRVRGHHQAPRADVPEDEGVAHQEAGEYRVDGHGAVRLPPNSGSPEHTHAFIMLLATIKKRLIFVRPPCGRVCVLQGDLRKFATCFQGEKADLAG